MSNQNIAGMDVGTAKVVSVVGAIALITYEVMIELLQPHVPDPSPLRFLLIIYTMGFSVIAYWNEALVLRHAIAFKLIPFGLTIDAIYRVYLSEFSFDTTVPLVLVIICCGMVMGTRRELLVYLVTATLGVTVVGTIVPQPGITLSTMNFTIILLSVVMYVLLGGRLQDQARLAENEKILERTEKIAGIGGWSYHPHTGQMQLTSTMYAILGLPPGMKPDPGDIMSIVSRDKSDGIEARVMACLATGQRDEWEMRVGGTESHNQRWIRTIIDRIGEGREQHIAGTSQDITASKLAEMDLVASKQMLEEANHRLETNKDMLERRVFERTADLKSAMEQAEAASRAKSEFLATMSHEIRTPMNGVLGMTELLRNTRLNNNQQRFADTIYDSATSLLNIINDILDLSKLEAGKFALDKIPVDLRELVEESIEGLAEQAQKRNLELLINIPPTMTTAVVADPVRLRQVLTNLVGNAIKFTEVGEVMVRLTDLGERNRQQQLVFEVIDSGIGISPSKQQTIFESFTQEDGTTTRMYGGTGLGLAISQQIVGLMGSNLRVDSTPGKGARFFFEVTLGVGRTSGKPDEEDNGLEGMHALVVDNNTSSREVIVDHLRSWQIDTTALSSAEEALHAVDTGLRPCDLVIVDGMPRTDGITLTKNLRSRAGFVNVPVVMLCPVAAPLSEAQMQELGVAGQVSKPIKRVQFRSVLKAAVTGKPATLEATGRREESQALMSGHVLLAEDNVVNQAVATGMLEALGMQVTVANNGRQAVDHIEKGTFTAVLMDCQMPVLDGFAATREIRRLESSGAIDRQHIIAVTANALKGDSELCIEAGMDDYLSKPFTREALRKVLARCNAATDVATQEPPGVRHDALPAPAVDRTAIDLLATMQQPGAPDVVQRIIQLYLKSSSRLVGILEASIHANDEEDVRVTAHSLKSSSANLGANKLAELVGQLEMMGRHEDLTDAKDVLGTVLDEYVRVRTELVQICPQAEPAPRTEAWLKQPA